MRKSVPYIISQAHTRQYTHEMKMWLRALDYLQQENISLKERVADLLQYDTNSSFLEKVEYFQNKFLDKDAVLSLLRHDILELSTRISEKSDGSPDPFVLNKEIILRKDMEKMEIEFSHLKADFNQYIFDMLSEADA